MQYPVVIFKDPDSIYGIVVPDLPGCITAADTVEQVLTRAVEAIKCHLSGMLIDGEPIPEPKNIKYHQKDPEYVNALQWDTVTITLPELRHYPVLIHPARYRHYRLIVPDLPGCGVRGKTTLDALAKAGLAIEHHMETMVLNDKDIPQPKTIAQHREMPAYPDGQWVSVRSLCQSSNISASRAPAASRAFSDGSGSHDSHGNHAHARGFAAHDHPQPTASWQPRSRC